MGEMVDSNTTLTEEILKSLERIDTRLRQIETQVAELRANQKIAGFIASAAVATCLSVLAKLFFMTD
jgi:hypothetical protein